MFKVCYAVYDDSLSGKCSKLEVLGGWYKVVRTFSQDSCDASSIAAVSHIQCVISIRVGHV